MAEQRDSEVEELLRIARSTRMTPEDAEIQRQSFAYGNTKLSNKRITRESIRKAAETTKRR